MQSCAHLLLVHTCILLHAALSDTHTLTPSLLFGFVDIRGDAALWGQDSCGTGQLWDGTVLGLPARAFACDGACVDFIHESLKDR